MSRGEILSVHPTAEGADRVARTGANYYINSVIYEADGEEGEAYIISRGGFASIEAIHERLTREAPAGVEVHISHVSQGPDGRFLGSDN